MAKSDVIKGTFSFTSPMAIIFNVVWKCMKEFRKNVKIMHPWHGGKLNYFYHIYNDLRPEIFDYIPKKDGFDKRVGFIFGNSVYLQPKKGKRGYEIGIYAFLPLEKLIEKRGLEKSRSFGKIKGVRIEEIAQKFVKMVCEIGRAHV